MAWRNIIKIILFITLVLVQSESKVLQLVELASQYEEETDEPYNRSVRSTKYFMSTRRETAASAYELCLSAGYQLATIKSEAKNMDIRRRMESSGVDQVWTSGVQIESQNFGSDKLHNFIWNSTLDEIIYRNFANPIYNNEDAPTIRPSDPVTSLPASGNACGGERPVSCDVSSPVCTVKPEVCRVEETHDCVVTEPICQVTTKPCITKPICCETITPNCTVSQSPCCVTTKPICTVEEKTCTIVHPPCVAEQAPCIVSPPNCTFVPQPDCSSETTTTRAPCVLAKGGNPSLLCPTRPPKPCPPVEVCGESTIICPPPTISCPPPIVTCHDPVIQCTTPEVTCPEPVVDCPPPIVVCQPAETECFEPKLECCEQIVTCPPPKIVCDPPVIVCEPPQISCPPCEKPCPITTPPPPPPPTTTPMTTDEPCYCTTTTTTTTTQAPCPCDKKQSRRSLDLQSENFMRCISVSKDAKYQWTIENCSEERYFLCEA